MKQVTIAMLLTLFLPTALIDAAEKQEKKKELPELHHVVDVKLKKGMKPPSQFKTDQENRIVCKTCHGIKNIEEIPNDEVDKKADNFLRGGPYPKLTAFCYNCHDKERNTRKNIHKMIDEQGEIREENCKFCHEEVLSRDKAYPLNELKLRMAPELICFGCHLKTPHLNALQHQVEPDEKKLNQLKKSVKELDIVMPLSAAGEIMCVTCHTPHPDGVLDHTLGAAKQVADTDLDEGISYSEHPWNTVFQSDKQQRLEEYNRKENKNHKLQYQRIKTEVLLRLPAKDGSLCLACHTFKD